MIAKTWKKKVAKLHTIHQTVHSQEKKNETSFHTVEALNKDKTGP